MPRKKTERDEDGRVRRDRYSQIVAENLKAMIEAPGGPGNVNALTELVRKKTKTKTTVVSDFLDGTRQASCTIEVLGWFADELGVPITAFFVQPDKRDDLMGALRILSSSEPVTLDQVFEAVRELYGNQPSSPVARGAAAEAGKGARSTN